MKIDWDKARLIVAHRFEGVITACNKGDAIELQALMECGLASPEDYMIEDDSMKLDEKGCFIYKGFICQTCDCYELHKSADDGPSFYICRVAIYDDKRSVYDWIIIPYVIRYMPSSINVSEWQDFIHLLDEYITEDMHPVSYDEAIANAMVK